MGATASRRAKLANGASRVGQMRADRAAGSTLLTYPQDKNAAGFEGVEQTAATGCSFRTSAVKFATAAEAAVETMSQ